MPAAAVIPAPIAYIKVVAVKKLVVGFLWTLVVVVQTMYLLLSAPHNVRLPFSALNWVVSGGGPITLNKLECSKQAILLP